MDKNGRRRSYNDFGFNQFQGTNTEEKMLAADKFGKQLGELKEDLKVLTYSLELAEKREKKLILELEDWKQRASKEVEESLTGNKQKVNLIDGNFLKYTLISD